MATSAIVKFALVLKSRKCNIFFFIPFASQMNVKHLSSPFEQNTGKQCSDLLYKIASTSIQMIFFAAAAAASAPAVGTVCELAAG